MNEKAGDNQQAGSGRGYPKKIHAGQELLLVRDAFDARDLIQGLDGQTGFGPAAVGTRGEPGEAGAQYERQRQDLQDFFHGTDSVEIKHQHLRRLGGVKCERAFLAQARGIAAGELLPIDGCFAFRDMHPGMPAGGEGMSYTLPSLEFGEQQVGVLMNGHGAVAASLAGDEIQLTGRRRREILFGIPRFYALRIGLNPDLQQMHGFFARRIKFAMAYAAAGRHVLHVAGLDDTTVAHGILMLKLTAQDVSDDLHIAMRMRAETHAWHHEIVVDDAQALVAHPLRIVIIREAEGVIAVQPAVTGMAPFIGFKNINHG